MHVDAGIKEGSVRLIGGGYMWEGRVEIFSSGVWSSITYKYYTNTYTSAGTVCRQLGYSGSSKLPADINYSYLSFLQGGPIAVLGMDKVLVQ